MKRIAIIGGGISGLTAAYELELARQRGAAIDWHLYEASDRLGGIIETTRLQAPEGEYILEGGPDGWVSEKPWARELAVELGLESELIYSNDATRKTYIYLEGKLQPIPDGMRMMVPDGLDALSALDGSPLFSLEARAAYAAEPARAEELKRTAPAQDESVASFVRRHFGDEVLEKIAAPLLSGVFGGDVHKLSVRAVMPQFVRMEQEHGSLILALEAAKAERGNNPRQPIFTSLKHGVGSLAEAIVSRLPPERLQKSLHAWPQEEGGGLFVLAGTPWKSFLGGLFTTYRTRSKKDILEPYGHIIMATPLDVTRSFIGPLGFDFQPLPKTAASAVLVALTWPAELASTFSIPAGFGFLVPQPPASTQAQPSQAQALSSRPEQDSFTVLRSGKTCSSAGNATEANGSQPQLLAATFVDQKFPHRAPAGARVIRAFFGSDSAERFANLPDAEIAQAALHQLQQILGPLPAPTHKEVRRWPRSLPQYEVGHPDRMAELDLQLSRLPGLHLLGNSYRGVGLPDLIYHARTTARKLTTGD